MESQVEKADGFPPWAIVGTGQYGESDEPAIQEVGQSMAEIRRLLTFTVAHDRNGWRSVNGRLTNERPSDIGTTE